MSKIFVIYHSADFDGILSREIAMMYFARRSDVIFTGWNYGDPVPPIPADAELYMVDISIAELMEHPRLVWIDHHKSAIEEFSPAIRGYRIDGVAACRLAWQWFFTPNAARNPSLPFHLNLPEKAAFVNRHVDEPWAVRLAGEYDVWDKRNADAELFQHGLRSCEVDFARLLLGDDGYVGELLAGGRVLQCARERENKSIIEQQGFDVTFEGLRFIACNAARFNSLLFTAALTPEHDGCLGFNWNGKQGRWKVSLYGVPGKPDIDFSVIAKKYGGGGHKQACGFEAVNLPFGLSRPGEGAS